MTNNLTLGFIGTGMMGKPMTQRLLDAGRDVVVYNRTSSKLEELKNAGAKVASSPAELAAAADIICLCLTNAEAVEAVVFANEGIAVAGSQEKLIIDFSSISPADTKSIAQRLREKTGARWIDAPVSGGVGGAQQGKLVVMCGGEETDVSLARPVFELVSQRSTHMGPLGSGQITKLCNQIIVSCNLAVISEAINLARKANVNAGQLPAALQGGFADSLPLQVYGPRMAAEHEADAVGEIYTMLKDINNAQEFAESVDAALPMTAMAEEIYQVVSEKGYLHKDLENLMRQFDKEDDS